MPVVHPELASRTTIQAAIEDKVGVDVDRCQVQINDDAVAIPISVVMPVISMCGSHCSRTEQKCAQSQYLYFPLN
jgi:hypothetical protein